MGEDGFDNGATLIACGPKHGDELRHCVDKLQRDICWIEIGEGVPLLAFWSDDFERMGLAGTASD